MLKGRPSALTKWFAKEICRRLSEGESLRSVCKVEGMPAQSTIYKWLSSHPQFAEQYARARALQADTLVDEILAIADDASRDAYTDEAGVVHVDHEHIQRSRLRVDARKWYAAKVLPKKYGDKIEHSADDALSALLGRLEPTMGPPGERAKTRSA